jgi:phage terminase small subunit
MPRTSRAATAMGGPFNVARSRLQPPDNLPEDVGAIFRRIVASCDPSHFVAADRDLLVRYCRAIADADRADRELAAGGFVVEGKPSAWLAVQREANRAIATLSTRLRLSPQARSDPKTVARRQGDWRPSIYDQLGWTEETDA